MNANLGFKIGDLVYSSIPDSPQMKIDGFIDEMAICVWFSRMKVFQKQAFALNTLRTTEIDFSKFDQEKTSWF